MLVRKHSVLVLPNNFRIGTANGLTSALHVSIGSQVQTAWHFFARMVLWMGNGG